jgi:hypothetical protein
MASREFGQQTGLVPVSLPNSTNWVECADRQLDRRDNTCVRSNAAAESLVPECVNEVHSDRITVLSEASPKLAD